MKKLITRYWLDVGAVLFALAIMYRGYHKPVWYHVQCKIGVTPIADFWTTNKAAVSEWLAATNWVDHNSPFYDSVMADVERKRK